MYGGKNYRKGRNIVSSLNALFGYGSCNERVVYYKWQINIARQQVALPEKE
jgi:hypothetical protein